MPIVRGAVLSPRRANGRRKFSAIISTARLGIKVPLPSVPAEEITAWYQHPTRHVSYNNGQYETESIYERKYLSGNDQYAVFLNSNQAQTVIEGSGKSGKLLLIKDSYGNTFFPIPRGGLCGSSCPRPPLLQGRCSGVRQRERYHRYAGAVRYAELRQGHEHQILRNVEMRMSLLACAAFFGRVSVVHF